MALAATMLALFLVALVLYQSLHWLCLLFFHPVASYPGLGLARFTNFWYAIYQACFIVEYCS